MLVKFPVWEYYNTQLGFSLQLNSNTKRTFDSQKSKVLFCVHGAIISQPLFVCCGIVDYLIMISSAFPVDYFPASLSALPVDVPKEE